MFASGDSLAENLKEKNEPAFWQVIGF